MRTKKQRIISFLMAFLLIFTFAFINPLTVVKSYAFAPVLTVVAQRIIAGVLISSGIVIKGVSDLTDTQKQDMINDLTSYIWWNMSLIERGAVLSLQIIENVVNIPVNIYNMIKSKVQTSTVPDTFAPTLEAQAITTKYSKFVSDRGLPNLDFNVYEGDFGRSGTAYDVQQYNMEEANPFFVYEGVEGATALNLDSITTNIFNYDNSSDLLEMTADGYYLWCSPDLTSYNIPYSATSDDPAYQLRFGYRPKSSASNGIFLLDFGNPANNYRMIYAKADNSWFDNISLYDKTIKVYFIKSTTATSDYIGTICEIWDSAGIFLYQFVYPNIYPTNTGKFGEIIYNNISTTINPNLEFEVETNPAPVITNEDATENILTLPETLVDTVGATSSQINVDTTTDLPNNETMENINTNVGELVTGGTLGEQVNTNIGTVEGLHGELTEQVDFGAVFDTIAQYISALDISSVTWFPVAVASFLVPFLPVISLGIILFFIDRVLNGGA